MNYSEIALNLIGPVWFFCLGFWVRFIFSRSNREYNDLLKLANNIDKNRSKCLDLIFEDVEAIARLNDELEWYKNHYQDLLKSLVRTELGMESWTQKDADFYNDKMLAAIQKEAGEARKRVSKMNQPQREQLEKEGREIING